MSKKSKKNNRNQEKVEDIKQEDIENEQDNSNENDEKNQSQNELEICQKELEECKDKYLRAHADFENMKKRLEKDKANAVAFANESFAIDLLSVIDSFESAIASMNQIEGDEAVDKIKEGVLLTYEQLQKVLKKHGVEEIENEGVFNPHVHQAIQQVDSDEHEKDEIVQVFQKGYKLKDRVLRPSMVSTKK